MLYIASNSKMEQISVLQISGYMNHVNPIGNEPILCKVPPLTRCCGMKCLIRILNLQSEFSIFREIVLDIWRTTRPNGLTLLLLFFLQLAMLQHIFWNACFLSCMAQNYLP